MDNFEKVEKIAERAHVSFEDAKAALEATNWDMLDAMIYLERQGKAAGSGSTYSTTYESNAYGGEQYNRSSNANKKTFGDKVKDLLRKSDENHFRITRKNGEKLIEFPIWLAIILVIALHGFALVLFIIGLFCGCGYSFIGPAKMDVANKVMNTCEETADSIKDAFNSNKNNQQ